MPASDVDLDSIVLSSTWRVAGTVGGDYLAAFPVGPDWAALCVADVSGKGLPAALLMSNLQAALKSAASENVTPVELCSQLNKLLNVNLPMNRFITCFYGLVDLRQRILHFTNAGHTPALLVRGSGRVVRLHTGGCVLGAFPDSTYEQGEVDLYSGDRLALFTDGVTEARNASGEEFGELRLRQLLSREHHRAAADLQQMAMSRVSEFCAGHFEDDAALMVLEVR